MQFHACAKNVWYVQATPQTFVKDIFLSTGTYERSKRAIPLLYKPGMCIKSMYRTDTELQLEILHEVL